MNKKINFKSSKFLVYAILVSLINIGWFSTYTVNIRDVRNFYSMVNLKNAPEVMISTMKDQRKNRNLIGRIGSLKFVSDMPVNKVFSDRIAARLKTNGFNIVRKKIADKRDKIERALRKDHADSFIAGDVLFFSFTETDPGSGNVAGKSVFNIRVYDIKGINVFEKYFFVRAGEAITKVPLSGAEKIVEDMFTASINVLFNDPGFASLMGIDKTQHNKLKDSAYYDKNLSEELNALLEDHNSLKISKKEFLDGRDRIIKSF